MSDMNLLCRCIQESEGDIEAAFAAYEYALTNKVSIPDSFYHIPSYSPSNNLPVFPTRPEDYPRNKRNHFVDKYEIATAARMLDTSSNTTHPLLDKLRKSIPESDQLKLDLAISHLQSGGLIHEPNESPGMAISINGVIHNPHWAEYSYQLERYNDWKKREELRIERKEFVNLLISKVRKDNPLVRSIKDLNSIHTKVISDSNNKALSVDEHGMEHAPAGTPEGGQFVSKGEGKESGSEPKEKLQYGLKELLKPPPIKKKIKKLVESIKDYVRSWFGGEGTHPNEALPDFHKEVIKIAEEKARDNPEPTEEEIKQSKEGIEKYGARRYRRIISSNSTDRRMRRNALLKEFGDGESCPCVYCGIIVTHGTLEQDMIHPRSQGGRYRLSNLVPSCRDCGFRKRNMSFSEAIEKAKKYGSLSEPDEQPTEPDAIDRPDEQPTRTDGTT